MATTRDQAYQQYKQAYGSHFDKDAESDFEGAWNNANLDSAQGASGYSGAGYGKTWEDQMVDVRKKVNERFNTPAGMGPDSRSPNSDQVGGQPASGLGMYAQGSSQMQRNPQLDDLMSGYLAQQKANMDMQNQRMKQQAAWSDQMRSNIMDRYNKASGPVDMNDPRLASQLQVHRAETDRALNRGREAMAARGATMGTPQGASDAYLQSSYENMGRDNAAFASNLQAQEYDKNRQEIQQALQLGAGILTGDENRALQNKLTEINQSIDLLGTNNQFALGSQGLGLEQQRINNQNSQFYDNMGWQTGLQEALMNQAIMQQLMG